MILRSRDLINGGYKSGATTFCGYDAASSNVPPAHLRRNKSVNNTVKGELFFVRKVPLTLQKIVLSKSVPLSADSGLRLCLKKPPPFVKGGRKLLVCSP